MTMNDPMDKLRNVLGSPAAKRELAVGRASAALATLIAQRLRAKGITQAELAATLGITPGAISRKLNEGSDMRLSSVAAILWALDVPLHRELERLCAEGWQEEGFDSGASANVITPRPSATGRARPAAARGSRRAARRRSARSPR